MPYSPLYILRTPKRPKTPNKKFGRTPEKCISPNVHAGEARLKKVISLVPENRGRQTSPDSRHCCEPALSLLAKTEN